MSLILLFGVAITMAVFGTIGYIKGARWSFIALIMLFGTLFVIKFFGDSIVVGLNGMYMGVMLVLNGGLGYVASGDMDEVQKIMASIKPPFQGDTKDLAYLLVIGIVVVINLIMAAVMTSKSGVFGLVWGIAYGYLLVAGTVPLISDVSAGTLPIPLLYPIPRTAAQTAVVTNTLWTRLAEPQSIVILTYVIGGFLAILLLLTVRRGVKKG